MGGSAARAVEKASNGSGRTGNSSAAMAIHANVHSAFGQVRIKDPVDPLGQVWKHEQDIEEQEVGTKN